MTKTHLTRTGLGANAGSVGGLRLGSDQTVDGNLAFALDVDGLRALEIVLIAYAPVGHGIDQYGAGAGLLRDAGRDVDGIAPQVVDELLHADHPRHYPPGPDAVVDLQARLADPGLWLRLIAHFV